MSEMEAALETEKCVESVHVWTVPAQAGDMCQCGESTFVPWEPTLKDVMARLDQVMLKLDYLENVIDAGVCRYGGYD